MASSSSIPCFVKLIAHELVKGRAETFGEKDGGAAVACLPAADVIRLPASHRHYILSENREYILLMDARSRIVPSALP
jgi:hypothetical protein